MKIKIFCIALFTSSFLSAQTLETQTRDNAGDPTTQSGFYQTSNPVNFPSGATSWWHLLDVRHTNPSNNYGMQFAGSFFDQELWFRKTENNASQPWRKVIMENQSGNVGLGISSPQAKLDVLGNIRVGDSNNAFWYNGADINLKASSRGSGGRAIVHDGGNALTINYDYDFNGGTRIGKSFLLKEYDAMLQGKFEAKEVKVTQTPTADFVFEEKYDLPKLEQVEKFIKENKHLPEVASAKTMEKEGVNIGEFQIKLLQKIEELTLYSIEQNKQLKLQAEKIEILEKQIQRLLIKP